MKAPREVSNSEYEYLIVALMWISRYTLDRKDFLDDERYIEEVRKILDQFGMSYDTAEQLWKERRAKANKKAVLQSPKKRT